ncbi:MAG TPA: DUF2214 family protein, partial [Burkholderiales bacterium]|nr:DUF2214 family protein [Burkholderiales bacterium]
MLSVLAAFVHHLAAFTLVSALVAEHLLFDRRAARPDRRLQVVDAVYGASAGLLLLAGLARVFYFEKGAAYYFANPYFVTKLVLFIAVALLSAYPTLTFLRWRHTPEVTPAQGRW